MPYRITLNWTLDLEELYDDKKSTRAKRATLQALALTGGVDDELDHLQELLDLLPLHCCFCGRLITEHTEEDEEKIPPEELTCSPACNMARSIRDNLEAHGE